MAGTCFMSFLLAGSEVAPHSPGSGRAFSFTHRISASAARLRDGLAFFIALCIPLATATAAPRGVAIR